MKRWRDVATEGSVLSCNCCSRSLSHPQRQVEVHNHLNGSRIVFSDGGPQGGHPQQQQQQQQQLLTAPELTQEVVVISPGLPTPPLSPFRMVQPPSTQDQASSSLKHNHSVVQCYVITKKNMDRLSPLLDFRWTGALEGESQSTTDDTVLWPITFALKVFQRCNCWADVSYKRLVMFTLTKASFWTTAPPSGTLLHCMVFSEYKRKCFVLGNSCWLFVIWAGQ